MVKYVLTPLLILVYSAGIIGIGVYNCRCSHNGQIVLFAHKDCTCHHEHGCGHDQDQDEENCCDVKYQVLQVDQDMNDNIFTLSGYSIATVLFLPVALVTVPAPHFAAGHNHDPPLLAYFSSPDIYCLSQLRL